MVTSLKSQISQGDIFLEVSTIQIEYETHEPIIVKSNVVMITHDCDFDKAGSFYCLVAEFSKLSEMKSDHQKLIKGNRIKNYFYISGVPNLNEIVVDFRKIHRIPKDFLKTADKLGNRIASLCEESVEAIQYRLHEFFSRSPSP